MSDGCQVDFYVLEASAPSPAHLACRLCLRAWQEGFRVSVLVADEGEARALDDLMWDYPDGRFLPHGLAADEPGSPVVIVPGAGAIPTERDVVVNLTPEAVQQPTRFRRLLEIVPADEALRDASRNKYRWYRSQGLQPHHHSMRTF